MRRELTPDEEAAYQKLAEAARELREAQERAERQSRRYRVRRLTENATEEGAQ